MTGDDSIHLLTSYKEPANYPRFSQSVKLDFKYDLMVVVPVFNAEKYLIQCIDSLINQETKYSYIIVIVDDGSKDSSIKILSNYQKYENLKVIATPNLGAAHARNIALKCLYAEYLMFVDADDFISTNLIEVLMDAAYKYQADIVQCDYLEFEVEPSKLYKEHNTEAQPIKYDRLYGYPWGKVISSYRFLNLCFPEGYQFEDTIMATLLYPFCSKVYAVPRVLYYYRKNPEGITETIKEKRESIDTFWMTKFCLEEGIKRGYKLKQTDYERFLKKIRLNWMRIQQLPENIREAIWIQTVLLYKKYYINFRATTYLEKLIEAALINRSFDAYELLMRNWNWINQREAD